jgi:two-component system chemotaxis response regulator CheY
MFTAGEKVLIVDSMISMRKLIAKTCAEIGITEILEANDAGQAWEIINANQDHVKLVISDWQMPQGTGIDLLKRIRADTRLAKLPFIMMSAAADPKYISDSIKAGVNSFLVKPFTASALTEKITAIQKNKVA